MTRIFLILGSFDGNLPDAIDENAITTPRKTIYDQCKSIERLPKAIARINDKYVYYEVHFA